jgi:hypothetical protein
MAVAVVTRLSSAGSSVTVPPFAIWNSTLETYCDVPLDCRYAARLSVATAPD